MPKSIETALRQIDRRAEWYGMSREKYISAWFNEFDQHDGCNKSNLAMERLLHEEEKKNWKWAGRDLQ